MTEPPGGWTSPSGEPAAPLSEGPPPESGAPYFATPAGYGQPPPPPGYGQPSWGTPGYGAPVGLKPGVVPLRPLTVGELLDGAVSIIRRYPRPTLGMSALVAVVTTLLNVLALLATDISAYTADVRSGSDFESGFSTGPTAAAIPGAIVGVLAGIVLTGVLVVVVGKAVLGRPTTAGEVWSEVRGRLWALVGLAFLTGLLASLPAVVGIGAAVALAVAIDPATLFFGIPLGIAGGVLSVYLYVRLSLCSAVLVLEKASITTALTRSGVLVKGSWWRVFGILILTSLITSIVSGILVVPVSVIGGIVVYGTDASTTAVGTFLVITQVAGGLASFLITPFSAGVSGLLYIDRRMRAEGLDLTLQAAARA